MTPEQIKQARDQILRTRSHGDEALAEASNHLPIGVDVALDGWAAALDEAERLRVMIPLAIARSVDEALGEVARQQGGIAEPTATEARGAGLRAASHLTGPL